MQSGSSQNYFPLDLEGILEVGLEEWQKNFYWPISWIDFLRLEEKITDLFDRYIQEYRDHFLADLILINYKSYIEYSNFIHELLVLNDLKKKQLKPLFMTSERYREIYQHGVPDCNLCVVLPPNPDSWLRSKYQNLKLRRRLAGGQALLPFVKPQGYITDVSLSDDTLQYVKKNLPGKIKVKSFSEWTKATPLITANEKHEIQIFCKDIVKRVSEIASDYRVTFNDRQFDYLKKFTENFFLSSYQFLRQVEESLNGAANGHLFLGSNNNVRSRILSAAIRKRGGKVSAFSHGEPMVYNWKKISWMELSLVDHYFEYSDGLAGLLKESLQKYPTPNGNRPEIKSWPSQKFQKLKNRCNGAPPKKIEKVMVMGNYYRESGLSCVTSFPAPVQYDLEIRIIQLLRRLGFKVIYKKHPECELRNDFFQAVSQEVEVISDTFEKSWDKTDAYLFYYTRTTAFGPALYTNKPIFILDGGWENIQPSLKAALAKRCVFIDVTFNRKNLIELYEDTFRGLSKGLEKAQDTLFVENYL